MPWHWQWSESKGSKSGWAWVRTTTATARQAAAGAWPEAAKVARSMMTRPWAAARSQAEVGATAVGNEAESLHGQVFFGGKRLRQAKS